MKDFNELSWLSFKENFYKLLEDVDNWFFYNDYNIRYKYIENGKEYFIDIDKLKGNIFSKYKFFFCEIKDQSIFYKKIHKRSKFHKKINLLRKKLKYNELIKNEKMKLNKLPSSIQRKIKLNNFKNG